MQNQIFPHIKFKHTWSMFVLIFSIAILKSGVWVMANLETSRQIALSPFKKPFEGSEADYLVNSWFINFLAHTIQFTSPAKYLALHAIAAVLSIFVGYLIISKRYSGTTLTVSISIFAILPVNAAIFYWIGMDGVLVCLFMTSLLVKNTFLLALLGIFIGMQHFELGIVAVLTLFTFEILIRKQKTDGKSVVEIATLLLGVLIGKVFLIIIFRFSGIVLQENRFTLGIENFRHNLVVHVRFLPAAIFTMFGVLWILILKMESTTRKAFLIASAIPVLTSLFVWDQTRVLQISSTLLVMRAVVLNETLLKSLSFQELRYLLFAWLIVPWIWIWQAFLGSVTGYDIMYLYSRVFNTETAPSGAALFWWAFPRALI